MVWQLFFGRTSIALHCIVPPLFSGKVKVVLESQDMLVEPIRVLASAVIFFSFQFRTRYLLTLHPRIRHIGSARCSNQKFRSMMGNNKVEK